MRITGCLIWYDEQPAMLDRCVRSLAGACDHLVALDGACKHYPDGAHVSPLDQWLAIEDAADEVGLTCHVDCGETIWPSETAKRAALLQMVEADLGAFVLSIDADERVTHSDPDRLRAELADTAADYALVGWSQNPPKLRRLYRALPDLTVQDYHNGYHAAGRFLHRLEDTDMAGACDCSSWLHLTHDRDLRDPERNKAGVDYRVARRAAGEENPILIGRY